MWNNATYEAVVDDDEPPRYMRLAFDNAGLLRELGGLSFGNGTRYLYYSCDARPEVNHRQNTWEAQMSKVAKPVNGSYGVIDGVSITEEVIARLVKNAEDGFPGTRFHPRGRPSRTDETSHAVTVRLSESELAAAMVRATREHQTRSEAIRAALAAWANAS